MATASILDVVRLRRLARDFGADTLDRRSQAMIRALNIFEAIAVEIAPVDLGNLEAATTVRILANRPGFVSGELVFSTPYAARVHELDADSRGPRTKAKPGNEFGPAGPKYVERALRGMAGGIFLQTIAEELRK